MAISIYNVLTKKKELFKPLEKDKVKVYICGVTVYGRCHVGHLRCYLSFDAILRYFKYRNYNVQYVRNYTDIDDKIIARAMEIMAGSQGEWRKEHAYNDYDDTKWKERLREDEIIAQRAQGSDKHLSQIVADHFIDAFKNEDFKPFGLLPTMSEPRVSEHIPEVIALIEKIIKRGFAYVVDGDVYFDVPSYHNATSSYGKLSGRDFTQLMDGARVATSDKKQSNPDFALWKKAGEGEPSWDSPWGKGRPGWHIECSAMSVKELGQPFDIHGGGKDLIFPHHENEIAQSEGATGKPFCNTWMHNGFVTVDGVKMSKSLGNFISISEALKMAPPEVWRYMVLGTHYANPIDFSRTREDAGKNDGKAETVRGTIDIAYERVEYFYETLKRANEAIAGAEILDDTDIIDDPRVGNIVSTFQNSMDDDFNTAKAVASIGESMKFLNELCDMKAKKIKKISGGRLAWQNTISKIATDVKIVSGVLCLCDKDPVDALLEMREFLIVSKGLNKTEIEEKINLRTQARANKDWSKSDQIRDELLEMHVELRDGSSGTNWKVIR